MDALGKAAVSGVGALSRGFTRDDAQTQQVDSQIDRMGRICNSLVELRNRLSFISRNVRGTVPENGAPATKDPEPELTLMNLSRIAEILLERCHIEANEIASQIGG